MSEAIHSLSNTQLEILKAFSHELSNKELLEFKEMVAQYFANRSIKSANKAWEEKEWTNQTVDEMLNTKMRKRKNNQ